MTASSVNNFPLRPLKTPFAGTALTTANTSTVGGVNVSTLPATGDNVANVATGFPETFSTSITKGGKYLKRADVNALGYIATIMAFRQQMGMPNEWNKQICDAIGGYPKGAVLDYCIWNGTIIKETYKITSLTDDNTEDPTSTAQSNWKNWARVSVNADYVEEQAQIITYKDNNQYWRIWPDGFIENAGILTNRSGTITTKVRTPYYANVRAWSSSGGDDNDYGASCWAEEYKLNYYIGFSHIWNPKYATMMYWKVQGFI